MSKPDLKVPVEELATQIELAMAMIYNLQAALINANGSNSFDLQSFFNQFRAHFKSEWEAIAAFLQGCHGFGADVTVLKDALGSESDKDCIEFLEEMSSSASALLEKADELRIKSGESAEMVEKRTEFFEQVLNAAEDDPPDMEPGDDELSQFINASVSASRPNGPDALAKLKDALSKIHVSLQAINHFWQLTARTCDSFVLRGSIRISNRQAAALGDSWKGYQDVVQHATSSIVKSCDAVTVHASGAISVTSEASKNRRSKIPPAAGRVANADPRRGALEIPSPTTNTGRPHSSITEVASPLTPEVRSHWQETALTEIARAERRKNRRNRKAHPSQAQTPQTPQAPPIAVPKRQSTQSRHSVSNIPFPPLSPAVPLFGEKGRAYGSVPTSEIPPSYNPRKGKSRWGNKVRDRVAWAAGILGIAGLTIGLGCLYADIESRGFHFR